MIISLSNSNWDTALQELETAFHSKLYNEFWVVCGAPLSGKTVKAQTLNSTDKLILEACLPVRDERIHILEYVPFKFPFKGLIFMDTPLNVCLERNEKNKNFDSNLIKLIHENFNKPNQTDNQNFDFVMNWRGRV